MKPACFDTDVQFINWVTMDSITANRTGLAKYDVGFFCKDCTPAYAAKMRAEGRCEQPDVQFGISRTEGRFGYLPTSKQRAA